MSVPGMGRANVRHRGGSEGVSGAALQIAPTEVRGALGSVNQLVICLGILGALLVNVVFPPTAWRTMFYLSALPAILLGLGARPQPLPT